MNSTTPILLAPIDLPRGALQQCREQAQALANALQEPVGLAMVDDAFHAEVGRQLEQPPADGYRRPMALVEPDASKREPVRTKLQRRLNDERQILASTEGEH